MAARLRPSASMAGFMSATVTLVLLSLCAVLAWSRSRKAMSPVPPAMSRMCIPLRLLLPLLSLSLLLLCAGVLVACGESWCWPGSSERTKWSFQRLWMPSDIRSFMVSYLLATDEKTSPTRLTCK